MIIGRLFLTKSKNIGDVGRIYWHCRYFLLQRKEGIFTYLIGFAETVIKNASVINSIVPMDISAGFDASSGF